MTSEQRRAAVLLDRDGTLIRDWGYIRRPDQVRLYKRAPEALRLLRAAGFKLAVVSNQSGIGRGFFSVKAAALVNRRLRSLLRACGIRLDGIFICPHAPTDGCACRKPAPGLARAAARKLRLDLTRSYVVGDTPRDLGLARRVWAASALVRTGQGRRAAAGQADHAAKDLLGAARWILKDSKK
jgi:D-glycero-D-manno-heptose 1,7-bisphosphate phosphatase